MSAYACFSWPRFFGRVLFRIREWLLHDAGMKDFSFLFAWLNGRFGVVVLLGGWLMCCTGCYSVQRLHPDVPGAVAKASAAPGTGGAVTMAFAEEPVIRFAGPMAASAFLTMPGDILLMHLGDSQTEGWLKQLGMYPAILVDVLDLQDPGVKYLHAEIVTDVPGGNWVKTKGFYPIMKTYANNQFSKSWSVLAVKQSPVEIGEALARANSGGYGKTGYCGDFVSWCFGNRIYSWWNRTPGLQRFIKFLWFPSAIDTADNLENSPDTSRVLEVQGGKWLSPARVETAVLMERLAAAEATGNSSAAAHAKRVLGTLQGRGLVGPGGEVLAPTFRLEVGRQAAR